MARNLGHPWNCRSWNYLVYNFETSRCLTQDLVTTGLPWSYLYFTKTVSGASCPDINMSVSDGGRCKTLVVQFFYLKHFPISFSLQHCQVTTLADQKDLIVSGDRRRKV